MSDDVSRFMSLLLVSCPRSSNSSVTAKHACVVYVGGRKSFAESRICLRSCQPLISGKALVKIGHVELFVANCTRQNMRNSRG